MPASKPLREAQHYLQGIYEVKLEDETSEGRRDLVQTLIQRADDFDANPVVCYAAWAMAMDVGAEAGLLAEAMVALERLESSFEVDARPLRLEVICAVCASEAPDDTDALVDVGMGLLRDCIQAMDYGGVPRLVAALMPVVVGRASDVDADLATELRSAKAECQEYRQVQASLRRLKDDPDGPASNRVVGRFHCLTRRDFDTGLVYLTRISDKRLSQLALADLSHEDSPRGHVEVAEGWMNQADREEGRACRAALVRASYWLDRAELSATDLDALLVEERRSQLVRAQLDEDERDAALQEAQSRRWPRKREPEWHEARSLPGEAPFRTLGSPVHQFVREGARYASTFGANRDGDTGISHHGFRAKASSVLEFSIHGGTQRVLLVLETKVPPVGLGKVDIFQLAEEINSGHYGQILYSAQGRRNNADIPVRWDLSAYEGRDVRVYMIDVARRRGWNFVGVSELVHRWLE